jgi:hypothetical protein
MNPPKKKTPLEKLRLRRAELQQQCRTQESKLENSLVYIRQHTGSLLFYCLSNILASPSAKANGNTDASARPVTPRLTDMLSRGKEILPVLWGIVRPLLINWGIQWVTGRMSGTGTRKK